MSRKSAVVTGITGQDGAYLAEFLLDKGYRVYGTYRRASSTNLWRIDRLGIRSHPELEFVELDITDTGAIIRLLERTAPDEVYNLAAQSFVGVSFDQPRMTSEITGLGTLNVLEAIRLVCRGARFYQASTSEMFGKAQTVPQNEDTPFHPRSPYGVAKLYAHWMTVNYRESYDLFATSGILFNHESPLRGREFVTRKITDGVARIHLGLHETLELGNLDARRDWGFAPEYVEGMWRMLQVDQPDTYVLAMGRSESVRDFVTMAFSAVGITIEWRGSEQDETGVDTETGSTLVRVDPRFYRPAEVDALIGDASRARDELEWHADTSLEELCRLMVEADLEQVRSELAGQHGC